jgi:hypothetical protein
VVIKPHIDIRDGPFRGDIAPASRSRWSHAYRLMLRHYAELTQQEGAAMLGRHRADLDVGGRLL